MAVCAFVSWLHGAALIYDFHNFGYTLMALSLGRQHWLVCSPPGMPRIPGPM
jgi:hypothetical protein